MEITENRISINDVTRVMIAGEWQAVKPQTFRISETWYVEWFIGGDPLSDKADRQSETFIGYEFVSPNGEFVSGPLSAIQSVVEAKDSLARTMYR